MAIILQKGVGKPRNRGARDISVFSNTIAREFSVYLAGRKQSSIWIYITFFLLFFRFHCWVFQILNMIGFISSIPPSDYLTFSFLPSLSSPKTLLVVRSVFSKASASTTLHWVLRKFRNFRCVKKQTDSIFWFEEIITRKEMLCNLHFYSICLSTLIICLSKIEILIILRFDIWCPWVQKQAK